MRCALFAFVFVVCFSAACVSSFSFPSSMLSVRQCELLHRRRSILLKKKLQLSLVAGDCNCCCAGRRCSCHGDGREWAGECPEVENAQAKERREGEQ